MKVITDLEELKAYQSECRKWAAASVLFNVELMKGRGDPHRFPNIHAFMQAADREIDEWEAKNPFPKFIPNV